MAKITLIKNSITGDKIVSYCQSADLKGALVEFLNQFPEYVILLASDHVGIRLNSVPVCPDMINVNIFDTDEIIIYPVLHEPISLTAMMTAAASAFSSTAATISTAAAAGVVASGTTGMAVTAAAYAGAIVGSMSFGTLITVAGLGLSVYSAFSAQKPAIAKGDGSPGEGSPTYGWNVEPTSQEGIPIPILYGTNKVGGNVISQATESIPVPLYDWFTTSDQGCSIIAAVFNVSTPTAWMNVVFNASVAVIGMYPPVRGFHCQLDPRHIAYLHFSYRVWSWGGVKEKIQNFVSLLMSNPIGIVLFMTVATALIMWAIKFTVFTAPFAAFVMKLLGIEIPSYGFRMADTGHTSNLKLNFTGVEYKDSIFIGTGWDIPTRREFIKQIKLALDQEDEDVIKIKQPFYERFKGGLIITNKVGAEYMELYDVYDTSYDNLGAYVTILIPLSLEAISSNVGLCMSDVECMAMALGDKEIFGITLPEMNKTWENKLHQVIALGEGPIDGVEQIFLNDSPLQNFKAVNAMLVRGGNNQVLGAGNSGKFNSFDYYSSLSASHSMPMELKGFGDYQDFITSVDFPANNVNIRCKFNAYKFTLKGKLDDLKEEHAIHFMILAGYYGEVNFDFLSLADLRSGRRFSLEELRDARCISQVYTMTGGIQEDIYRQYVAYPIMDILNKGADEVANYLPGGVYLLASIYGVAKANVTVDGVTAPINWDTYYDRDCTAAYKNAVWVVIQEAFNLKNLDTTARLLVRVIRISEPVGNTRYTDKMYIEGFDEISYSGYSYPNTAILGITARATGSLNSSPPSVTSIVRGRILSVPILYTTVAYLGHERKIRVFHEYAWFDEDINKYRSMKHDGAECLYLKDDDENLIWADGTYNNDFHTWQPEAFEYPTFYDRRFEYCNNPIWCLYDLLTNERYGLGNHINKYDIHRNINHWLRMAEHCDTMVPDGIVRASELGIVSSDILVQIYETDSDLYSPVALRFRPPTSSEDGGEEVDNIFKDINQRISDARYYALEKSVRGIAIFARNSTSGWTKSYLSKVEYSGLPASKTILSMGSYGSGGSKLFWTNGNPVQTTITVDRPIQYTKDVYQYQFGERRYELDIVMDEQCNAMDYVKQICDTFNGYPIWINGAITPIIDMPTTPVAVIGEGSVIQDSISINYDSIQQTPNILECQFSNALNYYEKDTRQYIDPDIDVADISDILQAIRKQSIKLLGVTRPSQILRCLQLRMLMFKLQPRTISFRMATEGQLLYAGDVFDLSHTVVRNTGKSGRIISVNGDAVTLDQDISSIFTIQEPLLSITAVIEDPADSDLAIETVKECSVIFDDAVFTSMGDFFGLAYFGCGASRFDEGERVIVIPDGNTITFEAYTYKTGTPGYYTMKYLPTDVTYVPYTGNYSGVIRTYPTSLNSVTIDHDLSEYAEGWMGYSIGSATQNTLRCRAIKVTPEAEGEVSVYAKEFNELIHGELRTPLWYSPWETVAYNECIYQYKNKNTLLALQTLAITSPLRNLTAVLDSEDTTRLRVSWAEIEAKTDGVIPAFKYHHARIEVIGSSYSSIYRTEGRQIISVLTEPLSVSGKYTIYAYGVFGPNDDTAPWSSAVSCEFDFTGQDMADYQDLNPVTSLWVRPLARGNFWRNSSDEGEGRSPELCFNTKQIPIKWKRVSLADISAYGEDVTANDINYSLKLTLVLDDEKATRITSESIIRQYWNNHHVIDADDFGEGVTASTLGHCDHIEVEIFTYCTGRRSPVNTYKLYPSARRCASNITVMPMYYGLYVNWIRETDWSESDSFKVKVVAINKTTGDRHQLPNKTGGDTWITTAHHIWIPVDGETKRQELGILNTPFSMATKYSFEVSVEPIKHVYGKAYSIKQGGSVIIPPGEDDTSVGSGDDSEIPDWMLSPEAYSIYLYDNKCNFAYPPSYLNNDHISTFEALKALTDANNATSITYSGVNTNAWECLRISYFTSSEHEYTKIYFNLDTVSAAQKFRLWVEYVERGDDGDYKTTEAWSYFGGDVNNAVSADGCLYELTGVQQNTRWFYATKGLVQLIFPKTIRTRYLRLVIAPGDNVCAPKDVVFSVGTLRFVKFLHVDELSAIVANMGILDAGEVRFNITSFSGWTPTFTDGAKGGMQLSAYGLAAWSAAGSLTAYINAETGAFLLGPGVEHSLESGGTFNIKASSVFNVNGSLSINAKGKISVITGGEMNLSGGTLNISAGESHWTGGTIHIYSGEHSTVKGVIVDPSAGVIRSANFSANYAGYSLNENGSIFAGDITSRGTIRCSVFEKNSVSAVAGGVYVPQKAAILLEDIGNDYLIDTVMKFSRGAFIGEEYIWAKSENSVEGIRLNTRVVSGEVDVWSVTRSVSWWWTPSIPASTAWPKGTTFMKYWKTGQTVGSVNISAGSGEVSSNITLCQNTTNVHPTLQATRKVVIGDLSLAPTTLFGSLTGNGIYADNCYLAGSLYLAAGKDITFTTATAWGDAALLQWKTPTSTLVGTIYCTTSKMGIYYNGTSGNDYIEGDNNGLTLNFIGTGGSYFSQLSLVDSIAKIVCNNYTVGANHDSVSIGHWDGSTWTGAFKFIQDETFHVAKIGFFGVTPAIRDQVSLASVTVTKTDASGVYGIPEKDLVNDLKKYHNELETKVNEMITSLQSYGLL